MAEQESPNVTSMQPLIIYHHPYQQ